MAPSKKGKRLIDLSQQQWEELCDGCARCCLVKLEDEDSGEIMYTNVACQHLDLNSCRCSRYLERAEVNHECMVLTAQNQDLLAQLPNTCAYRRFEQNEAAFHQQELSISGKVVSELYIHPRQLPLHIVEWIKN